MKDGELFFNKNGRLMMHVDSTESGVKFMGQFPAHGLLNRVTMKPLTAEEKKEITDRMIEDAGLIKPEHFSY